MKRILIAEDEFLVRIGLKTTIDWHEYGYVIVGEASNGKEALQIFDEVSPDILITDVKMPVMDGLELILEAKKRKKELQVVILSNYDDFEYARKAMQLGASQYLLKSEISEKELVQTLAQLKVEGDSSASGTPDLKTLQEQYLRKYFSVISEFDRDHTKKNAAGRELFPHPFYIALRCDGDVDPSEEEQTEEATVKSIESLFHSVMEGAAFCGTLHNNRLRLSAVCPVSEDPESAVEAFEKKCTLALRNARYFFSTDLQIGISGVLDGHRIAELLSQAEMARVNCFFTGENICIYREDAATIRKPPPSVSTKVIGDILDSGDREAMDGYISEIFAELLERKKLSQVRVAYIDFVSIAKSICEARQIDLAEGLSGAKFNYDNFAAMSSLRNVQDYVTDLYSAVYHAVWDSGDRYSHTIRHCMRYIDENYASNISLDNMALAVNMSRSYLSMIFKQETGINFITYLTRYRIEKAKELLVSTKLKIYEIADQVGFSSPYYFSKVFRDWTKMSCKEYKDRFAESSH